MNLLKIILLSLVFPIYLFSSNGEYWLVSEYEKAHKNQKEVSQNFNDLVQNNAIRVSKDQNKPVKIMMVYPGNQISDYWRRSKLSFTKRLDELNINYELIDYFTKPAALKEQSKQLIKALKNDTDYLIFTLDIKKHSKFIERLLTKSKPKLILQNITTPLKAWKDRQPFFYVGFDHVIGSEMLAKYYLEKVGQKGNYAVLYGTNGYVSAMRGNEFINYMNKHSDLKMVDSYYTNFNKEKAIAATKEILDTHKDLKFIYACSTDIALGALEVLKERNLIGKVLVNGWGGGSSELAAIEANELDVTVMRMNDDNGVAMAEAVKLDIEKTSSKIPQIYSGDFQLVKKGVDKEMLQEYKDRAFRYTK